MELKPREIIRFEQCKRRTFHATGKTERGQKGPCEGGFAGAQPAAEIETKARFEPICDCAGQTLCGFDVLEQAVDELKSGAGVLGHVGDWRWVGGSGILKGKGQA
jgi:hypothetical protein